MWSLESCIPFIQQAKVSQNLSHNNICLYIWAMIKYTIPSFGVYVPALIFYVYNVPCNYQQF